VTAALVAADLRDAMQRDTETVLENTNSSSVEYDTDSDGTVPPGCTPLFLETESAYLHTPLHLISRWAALIITTLVSLALTVVVLLRRERRK
jgi:hypothetical protein